MAIVKRANVVLQIKDTEVERMLDLGYNLIDDNGNVVQSAVPKTLEDYRNVVYSQSQEIEMLKAEIEKLKSQLAPKKSKKADSE